MLRSKTSVASLVIIACLVGCQNKDKDSKSGSKDSTSMSSSTQAAKMAVATISPSRAATTQPKDNNVTGLVSFTQMNDGVKVIVRLSGLAPNTTHGFHIHEKGDLSDPALASAGAHFNPEGHKHGGPQSAMAHAGDLGNVTSDANGNVNTEINLRGLTLDNGPMGIAGRSVIVHATADDLKTDPSGNSGARIAGGTIQVQK